MNHLKNLPDILSNNSTYSLLQKVLAILMIEKEHTTVSIIETLKKYGTESKQNSISASLASLMKSPISKMIIRDETKYPYIYRLIPEAHEIEFKKLYDITQKSNPYSLNDLLREKPELKMVLDDIKSHEIQKNKPATRQIKEKYLPVIEFEEEESKKQPERTNHVFDFNFNINIRFGK